MSQRFHPVADCSSLREGEGRTVSIQGKELALFCWGGKYFAIENSCTHQQAPLGAGFLKDGVVYCPMHGWGFSLETGACLSNPRKPVRTFRTRVENGQIEIEI